MNSALTTSEVVTTKSRRTKPKDWRYSRFGLSRQESRVIELAMEGHIDKQIAVEMGISLGTVRVYWKRIRAKTGVTRSESIARLAKESLKQDFDDLQKRTDTLRTQLENRSVIERLLRAFEITFKSSSAAVAVVEGAEGNVLLASAAFAELCGFEASDIIGRQIFGDPERTEEAFEELYFKPLSGRFLIRTKDGSNKALQLNACGAPGLATVLWADPKAS